MITPKTMAIECKKCEGVMWIDPNEWRMLWDIDCIYCWEESQRNWLITGYSDKKPPHNLALILADQEANRNKQT